MLRHLPVNSGASVWLVPFLLIVILSVGRSADVYIAQSATGAATGKDCNNAYSAAWLNTRSNWGSGSDQVGPGTTVHLCGTVSSELRVLGSGTSGNPITILFEPDAKISLRACGTCLSMNERSFIVVDGGQNGTIENRDNGTSGLHVPSTGISAVSCDSCEIKNLTIQNIYVHTGTNAEIDHTRERCIDFSGSNISVHDNTMHDAGWCLINWNAPGESNVRIYNNEIYNIDHGLVWGGPGSTTRNGVTVGPVYFYNNHVHDYANWDTSTNAYHHDGIHCYSTGKGPLQAGVHWADMWIYNNLFDGDTGDSLTSHIFLEPGIQRDGSQTPCMDATSKIHIFGNVFVINRPNEDPNGVVDLGVHSPLSPLVNLDFLNNTVLADDRSTESTSVALRIENGAASPAINVKNNIFGGANHLLMLEPSSGIDYNGYVNCVSNNCFDGTANFSAWKSTCNCDSHSVSSISTMGGVSTGTGVLQADSPMIGKGVDLSIVTNAWPDEQRAALLIDRNGRSRTSKWDIGGLASGLQSSSSDSTPSNSTRK